MAIHAPQAILLGLMLIEFGTHCAKVGEPRSRYNPATNSVNAVILLGLLWWGGFFG